MARKWPLISLAAVLLTILAAYLALPIIGELVTPGPVTAAHADTEDNCLACHVPFLARAQNGRCKSCHEEVAIDIETGKGFHGRSRDAAEQRCSACHTDHRGRGFDIAAFDREAFDHDLTDFRLTGAHTDTECADCHEPGDKYRIAPTTCIGCHREDDVHKGRFGKQCQGCHNTSDWTETHEFDHSVTGFNLLGKHRAVTCEGCHANNRFAGTPTACVACHREDDVHQGSKGDKCEDCHVATGWQFVDFNHNRDTRFPLTGAHRSTTCVGCHGPGERIERPPMTCFGCHSRDDVHEGRFGRDCAACHSTADWKSASFDHAKSGFPLRGAHAAIACKDCHVRPAGVVRLPKTCIGCHARDDPHRGRLGRDCASCHGESKWRPAAGFNHTSTGFPLTGRHRAISCTACHADLTYRSKGTTCVACHPDTRHAGRFGRRPDCAQCHDTDSWQAWTFDHDRQTGFALDGRHARLSCYDCHNRATDNPKLGSTCAQCHRADDIHRGEFGGNCGECHSTDMWKGATARTSFLNRRKGLERERAP